ncbi:hypothetical protein BGW80DRAFT_1376393 [Lactifluus volemus]|nr:hypothetical protein BGW80DRAFT_1376393 [Lactifluus volemus]
MPTPTYSPHSDSNLTLPSLLPIIFISYRIQATLSHLGWEYPGPKTSHLPELTAGEPCARCLALLLDSDESDIWDWAQKGYLKIGRTGRQLFEVNSPREWSAKKREEFLEKLKERLEGEKERRGRTGGEMFGKWLIDGHVDSVFRASPPFEDVAVSSNLSGSSGRLTTPGASIMPSPEQSPFRGNCHSSHHKSRRHDKSCPHSPGCERL